MPSCVQDFVCHYRRFMEQNKDFDQRLGTVLNLAFQHSKNLKSTFKVCILHPDPLTIPITVFIYITQEHGDDQLQ